MPISKGTLKADGLLLIIAIIWGFGFVAQRSGMSAMGPFAFSAVRFALGALSLLPLLLFNRRRKFSGGARLGRLGRVTGIGTAGAVLFAAVNLQQVGLVYTTAGNAGFITSLYVILVPLFGVFVGRPSGIRIWIGAVLAVAGLYLLGATAGFALAPGDLLVLLGAFGWAAHILVVARLAPRMKAVELAVGQFAVCAVLSLAVALIREPAPFAGLAPAAVPVLYGGLASIGIAYTLQIVAQKTAHPAHASIILAMEGLFAGIGGVLLLAEPVTVRLAAGGLLMLAGAVVSQLEPPRGG